MLWLSEEREERADKKKEKRTRRASASARSGIITSSARCALRATQWPRSCSRWRRITCGRRSPRRRRRRRRRRSYTATALPRARVLIHPQQ
eukprot:1539780-Pleurochrysis_carterae.AAC.1